MVIEPTTRLTDSQEHDYTARVEHTPGETTIAVRVSDENDNQSIAKNRREVAMHQMLVWMAQGTGIVAILMFVLWGRPLLSQKRRHRGRRLGRSVLALLAMIYAAHGAGYPRRTLILVPMVVIWGLRLALHLLFTRIDGQPEEGRYVELRRKWGNHIGLQIPALLRVPGIAVRSVIDPVFARPA